MNRKTLLASLAAAAIAPVALPTAAEVIETYNLDPVATTYYVAPARTETYTYYAQPRAESYTYYATPSPYYATREVVYESAPIVVEAPPLTADQAISSDVMDRLRATRG